MRAIARERCIEIEGYTLTWPTPLESHHWLWKNSVPASYQSQSPTSFTVNPRSQWARVGLRYCRMTSVDIGRHLRNRAPRCVKQPHLFSYHAAPLDARRFDVFSVPRRKVDASQELMPRRNLGARR